MQEKLEWIEIFQFWMLSLLTLASNKENEKWVSLLNSNSISQLVMWACPWKTSLGGPLSNLKLLFLDSDRLALKVIITL